MESLINGVLENADKISAIVVAFVAVIGLLVYMNRNQASRDRETDADSKARELDHAERTQLTTILGNSLIVQKEASESLALVSTAMVDMRREIAVNLDKHTETVKNELSAMLQEQNASFMRQLKVTMNGGVRMQLGIMQLNNNGKIVMANEDAMYLLGVTDGSLLVNRQLYNLGLRVTDIDGRVIEDFNSLPFANAIRSGRADVESALLGIQLPDFSWRWLLMNISPVFGPNQQVVQILLTFYDAGKLVVMEKLEKTEDITNHGNQDHTLPSQSTFEPETKPPTA